MLERVLVRKAIMPGLTLRFSLQLEIPLWSYACLSQDERQLAAPS